MQQLILDLLKEALFGIEANADKIDIDAVFEEALHQEVAPLIYGVLKKNGLIDKEKDKELLKALRPRIAKGNGVFLTHVEVSELFKDIEHTIIKGVASAKYYSEPFSRVMGDTDVIVKNIEKAKEILENNGYKCVKESDELWHIEYQKNAMSVELHHTIHGIPEKNSMVEALFDDLYEKTEKYQTVFGDVTVPSHFHNGLIMLLHMHTHFNSSGIGLRHLSDWAVFANSFSEDEFKEIFEEKLTSIGLWRFAKILSQTAMRIGLPYKNWMGEREDELSSFLLEDMLSGGNFGRKDTDKKAILSFVPKDTEKKSSPIVRYFNHGIRSIYNIWPTVKKHKILLPFAFIAYCFRILFRIFAGKTKIRSLKKGYDRREMIKKLNCFVKEEK